MPVFRLATALHRLTTSTAEAGDVRRLAQAIMVLTDDDVVRDIAEAVYNGEEHKTPQLANAVDSVQLRVVS